MEPLTKDNQNTAQSDNTGKKNAESSKLFERIFTGLIIIALSFFGGWLGGRSTDGGNVEQSTTRQRTILTNQSNVISEIASEVGPSVVSINVAAQTAAPNNPYEYFFGYGGGSRVQRSAGTGVILNSDGLIMTNRHVIPAGVTELSVTLSDGIELDKVRVVGRTSERDSLDVAFLKVEDTKGKKLTPAVLGDSSKMKVGDTVVAIGNALGQFENTVTSGIVSGYGRSIVAGGASGSPESLDDLFQTDAAINQGNSGGPLVNLAGEVIGINTAIASESQNIGFAIPVNNISGLIKTVERTGKLERPYLGVRYVVLTDDTAKQFNLPHSRGVYIPTQEQMGEATVISDGPAGKAGIKEGDTITEVNGMEITEKASLASRLGRYSAGDEVELTILRGNDKIKLTVTLGTMPSNN